MQLHIFHYIRISLLEVDIFSGVEVWAGGQEGKISRINVSCFTLAEVGVPLVHPTSAEKITDLDVCLMCAENNSVFTSISPGCLVYAWHGVDRQLRDRMDCSKIAPCSESLTTINIEERLSRKYRNCLCSAPDMCVDSKVNDMMH